MSNEPIRHWNLDKKGHQLIEGSGRFLSMLVGKEEGKTKIICGGNKTVFSPEKYTKIV